MIFIINFKVNWIPLPKYNSINLQMNKIETDSVYADSHTERVLINSTASRGGSKITKLKTDKKLPTPKFSVEEIEKDLLQ